MLELQNTLYATTPGTTLRLDHDTVRVIIDQQTRARLPLVRLQAIVAIGQVTVTTPLIHRCAEDGRDIAWFTTYGRFRARIVGTNTGNVLLRRAQHQALNDPQRTMAISRQFVAGKIQNSRTLILRASRDNPDARASQRLQETAEHLADLLETARTSNGLNHLRGTEGAAARACFASFSLMIRGDTETFALNGRTRRPPRDRTNALLSFLYALLRGECDAAAEGVGLDSQIGYLHTLRPGRAALALDLMEELRPAIADRLALKLVNRRQLHANHFEETPGGAVSLTDQGRRKVLDAYEQLKTTTTTHRLLKQKLPIGIVPHIQARILARHLRGDLAHYIPHLTR